MANLSLENYYWINFCGCYLVIVMKPYCFLTLIIFGVLILCHGPPHTKKIADKNISKYSNRTGESTAATNLIKEYERDHLDLYMKEAHKDSLLKWKAVDNKDLDDYCRRYLHQCVPRRRTWRATGGKFVSKMRYFTSEYKFVRNMIVVVSCLNEIKNIVPYYITRALEPNCVYALRRGGNSKRGKSYSIFSIMNKHCNFEQHDYRRKTKRYRNDNVRWHRATGQFMASDEDIKDYELEHHELQKSATGENSHLDWPLITTHNNLNEYCHKYIEECTINRRSEGVRGSWMLAEVKWRNITEKSAQVVVAKCFVPASKKTYYFTRALDTHCVYALIPEGKLGRHPFQIIFKHCNFDVSNNKQEIPESSSDKPNRADCKNIKSRDFTILETLQFFPDD